jgi:hypothetical protein
VRAVAAGVAVVLAIPIAAAVWLGCDVAVNEIGARRFAAQLFDHPLPPRTRSIATVARVGVLAGNGNHCDFVAALRVESSLPQPELRAHYEALRLDPAISGGAKGGGPLVVVERTAGGDPDEWSIVATDAGYPAGFDLRCH